MKRYCRFCKTISDFQIWTEDMGSRSKTLLMCPKCEHPREIIVRINITGDIISKWVDKDALWWDEQPQVKAMFRSLFAPFRGITK